MAKSPEQNGLEDKQSEQNQSARGQISHLSSKQSQPDPQHHDPQRAEAGLPGAKRPFRYFTVEHYIDNDLTLKRWRRFKRKKLAVASVWVLLISVFFSFSAEIWSNSKPLVLLYKGKTYFPVFQTYHPADFARTDVLVMDYRNLEMGAGDWVLWPINRWDPFESNNAVKVFPGPPSSDNLLGTDDRGRDVLARLLYGFRYSMIFALGLWALSYVIGTLVGALMGYFGGWTDLLGQRLVEVFESIPIFLLLLTLISIFNPSVFLLILFNTVFGWMFISIYVRAEFLRLRRREFVEAARAIGASTRRVVFKHILPNALGPLITFSPFNVAGNISTLAALDYLGFGLQPPTPSWGEMLGQAQKYFTVAWWLAVFTSLFLFITLVVLNLIGNGVRDAFDPRK